MSGSGGPAPCGAESVPPVSVTTPVSTHVTIGFAGGTLTIVATGTITGPSSTHIAFGTDGSLNIDGPSGLHTSISPTDIESGVCLPVTCIDSGADGLTPSIQVEKEFHGYAIDISVSAQYDPWGDPDPNGGAFTLNPATLPWWVLIPAKAGACIADPFTGGATTPLCLAPT